MLQMRDAMSAFVLLQAPLVGPLATSASATAHVWLIPFAHLSARKAFVVVNARQVRPSLKPIFQWTPNFTHDRLVDGASAIIAAVMGLQMNRVQSSRPSLAKLAHTFLCTKAPDQLTRSYDQRTKDDC
ncbi:unnamed protein product [Protopolystoma xenopodis]|uniref:Secreted protein n=1 Tax=Protopolystoma xenopodis TaxID=117903 RepID=A0A3S5AC36_9PLAT|nr:unnamed protein product [Protopolystoma xenopodis]